jgi:hypothetical protein
MSYELVYAYLERCEQLTSEDRVHYESLVQAVKQRVGMREPDAAQVVMAVGHNATLLEKIQKQELAADEVLPSAKDCMLRCR